MSEAVAWAVLLVWLVGAVMLMLVLRVFGRTKLAGAPPRNSTLSVVHLAGVFLLYLGTTIMAQAVYLVAYPPPPVPATAPATTSAPATVTATTSAPATMARDDTELRNAYLQIVYSLSLLVPTGLIIFLGAMNTRGGVRGFGMDFANFWPSVGKGAIGFLIVIPLMQVLQTVIEIIINWLHPKKMAVHSVIQMVESQVLAWPLKAGLIVTAVVLAPFCEELFFRGLLQTIFIQPLGTIIGMGGRGLPMGRPTVLRRWMVILSVAALFSAVHYQWAEPNPEHLPLLFFLGAVLGYTYERTGSLWASMTVHAMFNGFVLATLPISS